MKIVIFTIGTQGDARPFVALGRRLKELGHTVVIATSKRHEKLILGGGLEHAEINSDFAELMAREQATMESQNQLKLGLEVSRVLSEWVPIWVKQGLAITEDADLIIGSGSGTVLGASLAEKRKLPFVQAQFMPLTPSKEIHPLWPSIKMRLPGIFNLVISNVVRTLIWQMLSLPMGKIRKELHLKKIPWRGPWFQKGYTQNNYILYAFSRFLVPPPKDWSQQTTCVTGSWIYEEAKQWSPPQELIEFLENGSKPIYVGFGSMLSGKPQEFTQMILDGIRKSGHRAIVASGWGALEKKGDYKEGNIMFIDSAPHDWLFPRVAMAVHHGGAGTLAAASRAGLPQVIVPFVADQFFWGWMLHDIGVNPVIINRKKLTSSLFARSIRAALREGPQYRAQKLGRLLSSEDGIENAIEALTRWGVLSHSLDQEVQARME